MAMLGALGAAAFVVLQSRVVLSRSPSVGTGFYLLLGAVAGLERGHLVLLEPPELVRALVARRQPEARAQQWLKRVAGLPGEAVCYGEVLTIAGVVMGRRDLRGLYPELDQVPPGCTTVPEGMIMVLGTHPASVDSRYLGPLPQSSLRARVVPVWIWGGT